MFPFLNSKHFVELHRVALNYYQAGSEDLMIVHLATDICKMQVDDQNQPAKENQTTLKTSIRSHLILINLKPTSCCWPILLLLLNYNQTQCGFKSFIKCVTLHLDYLSQWEMCSPSFPCINS